MGPRQIRIITYVISAMNIPLAGADLTDSPVVSKDRSSAGDLKPADSGYAPVNGSIPLDPRSIQSESVDFKSATAVGSSTISSLIKPPRRADHSLSKKRGR